MGSTNERLELLLGWATLVDRKLIAPGGVWDGKGFRPAPYWRAWMSAQRAGELYYDGRGGSLGSLTGEGDTPEEAIADLIRRAGIGI